MVWIGRKQNQISSCKSATSDACESFAPYPSVLDHLIDRSRVVEVEQIDIASLPARRAYHATKRFSDTLLSVAASVVLSPLMLGIAVAVKLDSPGPAIYRQERLGKNGTPFVMHKFRSMYVDAEPHGPQWAEVNDSRITHVGKFLRKSRLDEIPQF